MGMYSWVCKGCKQELCEGEYVRLDGRRQIYDGYGGSAGHDGDYDPAAWHQRCYQKASVDEKLDEEPSPSAPNQGFGPAMLQFKKEYDETKETKYSVVVFGRNYEAQEGEAREFTYYLTDNGFEDQDAHDKKMETVYAQISSERPANWFEDVFMKMSREEQDAYDKEVHAEGVKRGGESPRKRERRFSSLEECLAAAEPLISALPYARSMTVYGIQDNVEGAVLDRRLEKQ